MALSTGMKLSIIMRRTRLLMADKEKNYATLEAAVAEVQEASPEYFEGVSQAEIVRAFEGFQETLG